MRVKCTVQVHPKHKTSIRHGAGVPLVCLILIYVSYCCRFMRVVSLARPSESES